MQMADRGLASPSSTRLDFHDIDAVLALYRPIQRNLGVVGPTTIPAVPVSDQLLHEALSFSPNAGDGRAVWRAWAVGGDRWVKHITRQENEPGFPSRL